MPIKLGIKEKNELKRLLKKRGELSLLIYSYILLALDKGKSEEEIMDFFHVSRNTIWRVKTKYKTSQSIEKFKETKKAGRKKTHNNSDEKELLELVFSDPPEGKKRWTLNALNEAIKEKKSKASFNRETIRQILKSKKIQLK